MKKLLAILAICLLPGVAWGATWYAINTNDFCAVGAGNVSTIWCDTDDVPACDGGAAFLDWDTGPVTNDIFEANNNAGITIAANPIDCAIDGSANATSVHLKNLQGGGFDTVTSLTPITMNTNITAGTADCLAITGSANAIPVLTIEGNLIGSAATTNADAVYSTHTSGTIQITGSVTGGAATTANGLKSDAAGPWSITGAVTGAVGNGVRNANNAPFTISGNATGGSGAGAYGVESNGSGAGTVTGDVAGGSASQSSGVHSIGTGATTIVGNLINSSASQAVSGRVIWNPTAPAAGVGHSIKFDGGGTALWVGKVTNEAAAGIAAKIDSGEYFIYPTSGVSTIGTKAGGGAWAN